MLSSQEINVLGNLLNVSFGQSSFRDAGHYINHKVYMNGSEGLMLEIRFETILTLRPDEVERSVMDYDNLSKKAILERLGMIKTDFRAECGKTLKVKELPEEKSITEAIQQTRTIYRGKYYRTLKFELNN